MNPAVIQGMLAVAGKIVPILQAVLTEIGPAVATLGADASQLVTDANKTLADLNTIFNTLKTNVVSASK
jgi:hypothetical protein